MSTSTEELRASLEAHNAEFEALLRLIPAKYYLVPEDSVEYTSKYQKNVKKQKAPKQAIKEASKKAKRDKLDPANNKTIVELQEEKAALKKANASSLSIKKSKAREVASDDSDDEKEEVEDDSGILDAEDLEMDIDRMDVDEDDNNTDDVDEDEDENDDGDLAEGTSKDRKDKKAVSFKPMQAPASIETLRAKLRARMEELRKKNGRGRKDSSPSGEAGPGDKDELLEERRKQRAAMRERRRKETKEKKRREREEREGEEEQRKRGKGKQQQTTGSSQSTKSQLLVPDVSSRTNEGTSQPSNVNITFSTLSGSHPHTPKSLKTPSNPTVALSQLQSRLSNLSSLPASERQQLEERQAWSKAQARVQGAKVHDDPSRLKKAAKRRDKEKERSKKDWEKRKEEVEKAQAARQKKRADNIATRYEKRKGGAKGGKGGKGGKKGDGKRRPGFEGKGFGGGGGKTKKVGAAAGKGKGRK